MKNITNIYDIDGELIRAANDNHELSVEEAQEKLKIYQEKIKNLQEKDPKDHKIRVYQEYCKNLSRYIFNQYILHPELFKNGVTEETTEDQIAKAMEDLKAEVEADEMDEYAQFEEIKDEHAE